ncbi:MAG TPA: M23 family metallopeptidase [Gaiellaceae bacterium]|nr:M23 family metallopeptidase [Gaiellaceae bacterium]
MGLAALVTALVLQTHGLQARPHVSAQTVWPARGTITSPFGRDGSRWHPGIDIGALRSLSVEAAVAGRVVLVGEARGYEGYGNVVVVSSSSGYEEIYAHLAAWTVRVGQRLRAGERIATAGCTGSCTGTHLHFEVRQDGKAVSPLATLLRPLRELRTASPARLLAAVLRPVLDPRVAPRLRPVTSARLKPLE